MGAARRRCCSTSATEPARPAAISANAQSRRSPSESTPTTSSPSATALSSAPATSKLRACGCPGGATRKNTGIPTRQIGTLTRNSHGQVATDSTRAAMVGPTAAEMATPSATMAKPRARMLRG